MINILFWLILFQIIIFLLIFQFCRNIISFLPLFLLNQANSIILEDLRYLLISKPYMVTILLFPCQIHQMWNQQYLSFMQSLLKLIIVLLSPIILLKSNIYSLILKSWSISESNSFYFKSISCQVLIDWWTYNNLGEHSIESTSIWCNSLND